MDRGRSSPGFRRHIVAPFSHASREPNCQIRKQSACHVVKATQRPERDASRPDSEGHASEPSADAYIPITEPHAADDLPSQEDAAIVRRVEALMRERHLYRDPDLTLERLARRAGIPARQISAALNRVHGRNVSQVVNGFRVEEVRRRLVSTAEPITVVMLEAGFGTKSNFNREFLRVTGMSPSAYRRSGGASPAENPIGEAAAPT